ncbi:amidohydrolase family protein [Marivirga arenosa]|uniref:Amidohydrolase family protein n=1 Tax=Marivirga arenosa TaxID=3059076 RepID=A0AA51N7F0_9BACT|nr:amidohydrolase family protein [Marivirga sp. ABR2-2]WMN07393.1 amidohydrolase family protein [Marivirga sp. ABR2-2]
MKHILNFFFTSLIGIILFSCSNQESTKVDLLLNNASIIDVKNDEIIESQFVAIKGDTIFSVGGMSELPAFEGNASIDLEGKYIMPGLWDNHVHFRGGEELIEENRSLLKLFPKFGITTVRDAGGDITPSVLEWRKTIQNKKLTGPHIFTSGPKLDGPNPAWAGSIKINNENDIEKALDSLQKIGADYVKMYDGSLTAENFYAIIKAAEKRGLKTTGHMPMSADLNQAIDLGLDGSEHMYYSMKACSPKADSLTELGLGYGMMEMITDTYDEELAKNFFKKMASNDVYITPTLYIGKVLSMLADEDHSSDSLLSDIGPGIQETYKGRIESAKRAKASGSQMRSKVSDLAREMVPAMVDNGVSILAGSDCGPFNSFVYPGEALWGELFSLSATGLTPSEVLSTSIINGPAYLGLSEFYGSIEKGKVADIIILNKNPLDNLENIRSLESVVLKGKQL